MSRLDGSESIQLSHSYMRGVTPKSTSWVKSGIMFAPFLIR